MAPVEMMVRIKKIISKVAAGGFVSCLVGMAHCKWDLGVVVGRELRSYGYPFPLLNEEAVGATKS